MDPLSSFAPAVNILAAPDGPWDASACERVIAAAVPEIALGIWTLRGVRVARRWLHHDTTLVSVVASVVRHCHVDVEDHQLALVLKHDPQRGGWHADRSSRLLRAARIEGSTAEIMRTFGVDPSGTLVAEMVTGPTWEQALHGDPWSPGLAETVAQFLVALQSSGAALDPGVDPQPESMRELDDLVGLCDDHPSLRGPVTELASALVPALSQQVRGPLLPAHGDLHPKNLIIAPHSGSDTPTRAFTMTAVDLDAVGLQEPALDVGYAAAHIVVSLAHAGVGPDVGARIAARLWDSYRRAGGPADDERIAVQAARAFTQVLHFELIGFGGGSIESLRCWSSLALDLLRSGRDVLGSTAAA